MDLGDFSSGLGNFNLGLVGLAFESEVSVMHRPTLYAFWVSQCWPRRRAGMATRSAAMAMASSRTNLAASRSASRCDGPGFFLRR